ncbi:MAG: methyltransferase domain-containing protein [Fibrobacter sp.]|nr:methyltransferase domain-containing protein [Fibrobacter sp.]
MKLRIISGKLRGRLLYLPDKGNDFRPTLERTRESVAEIIKSNLPDAVAVDLCAGSGAFGFEMLSRGCARVDFVEKDLRRAAQIKSNAEKLGVTESCRIYTQDVKAFLKKSGSRYDLIFYDPPYGMEDLAGLVPEIINLLAQDGILVYERSRAEQWKIPIVPFDSRVFGDTVVEFYRREEACSS